MSTDRDSFILSRNKSKSKPGANPKWPDFRGEATIGGRTYELAAWIRTKKSDGSKFFSGSVKIKEPKATQEPENTAQTQPGTHDDPAFDADPAFTP
jgi:hypothetical protein